MNKKGQSLIVFVMILPLLIFFIAFFIDSLLITMENNRIKEIVKDNLKISLNEEIRNQDIIREVIENNKDIKTNVIVNDNGIIIEAVSQKKNIFGNIFKISNINQKVKYCGDFNSKSIEKC